MPVARSAWFNPEFLESNYPLVVRFRSIMDYIEWRDPIVAYGKKSVSRALQVWSEISKWFREAAWPERGEPDPHLVQLAGVYKGRSWVYSLYSDMYPRVPYMPRLLALKTGDGVVWRARVRNKREYIQLLRLVIKAVIVVDTE